MDESKAPLNEMSLQACNDTEWLWLHNKQGKLHVGIKMRLKSFIAEVLKLKRRKAYPCDIDEENEAARVPEDVREGHFAVVAMQGEETKRFVVELEYLTDPCFLRLLEKAKEEYGFEQKGVLALPCNPQELQNIIDNRRVDSATT